MSDPEDLREIDCYLVRADVLHQFLDGLSTDEHMGDVQDSISLFVQKLGWPKPDYCFIHEHLLFPWTDREDWTDAPCQGENDE